VRFAECPVEGGSAEAEVPGDGGDGFAAGAAGDGDGEGVGVQSARAAAAAALGVGGGHAVDGAFADEVAFHLGVLVRIVSPAPNRFFELEGEAGHDLRAVS